MCRKCDRVTQVTTFAHELSEARPLRGTASRAHHVTAPEPLRPAPRPQPPDLSHFCQPVALTAVYYTLWLTARLV